MSGNGNNPRRPRGNNGDEGWGWGSVLAGAAGLALAGGGLYYLTKGSSSAQPAQEQPTQQNRSYRRNSRSSSSSSSDSGSRNSPPGFVMLNPVHGNARRGVPRERREEIREINNLNALLHDIYVKYVALNDDDFELHYRVFNQIFFGNLHPAMKEVDCYYNRYSSTVQIAGSHFDRLRIKKPDEFDVDIVIGLPVNIREDPYNPNQSDITLEPKDPGYVQLKVGEQFQKLYKRDLKDAEINIKAFEWKDDKNYLLRSNFTDWFKGVVDKGLNKFKTPYSPDYAQITVDGVAYKIRKSESGPAVTLYIENKARDFKLDVDLVPALKFFEDRWEKNMTKGYRKIPPGCSSPQKTWTVVPKPNKGASAFDMSRSWRVGLHEQERKLLHDSQNLRMIIQLIKKLRDSLGMNKIASYYIKTLFFWEVIERNDPEFGRTSPATLFTIMVKKFHSALVDGKLPYFWNKNHNLIGQINRSLLNEYAAKLHRLIQVLETPEAYRQVARFLLSADEYRDYSERFLHSPI